MGIMKLSLKKLNHSINYSSLNALKLKSACWESDKKITQTLEVSL